MSDPRRSYFLTAKADDGRIFAGCVRALSLVGACAVFRGQLVRDGNATDREFELEQIRLTHVAEEPEGLPPAREHIFCSKPTHDLPMPSAGDRIGLDAV